MNESWHWKEYKEQMEKEHQTIYNKDIEYLVLKLDKKIDLATLEIGIRSFVRFTVEKGTKNINEYTWRDIADILLKTDGSWKKKPYLYEKYVVEEVIKK